MFYLRGIQCRIFVGDNMGNIAFRKKTNKEYVQYTVRFESGILNSIKEIANKEELPINEVINQSLQFSIDNYNSQNK